MQRLLSVAVLFCTLAAFVAISPVSAQGSIQRPGWEGYACEAGPFARPFSFIEIYRCSDKEGAPVYMYHANRSDQPFAVVLGYNEHLSGKAASRKVHVFLYVESAGRWFKGSWGMTMKIIPVEESGRIGGIRCSVQSKGSLVVAYIENKLIRI